MVPDIMFATLVPPNPFMDRFVGIGCPMKSSILWEMQAEHRLSIPICSASVSNSVVLCLFIVLFFLSASIARTENVISCLMRPFLPGLLCVDLAIFRAVELLFFTL